jgi:PucR C-terminal helix-turn-helix domain/GGDEF-like domain
VSPTLSEIANRAAELRPVLSGAHPETFVVRIVLHERSEKLAATPGELILGIGLSAADAEQLIGRGALANSTGLVLRLAAVSDELALAARDGGVALMAVPPDIRWAQVHRCLNVALAELGLISSQSGDEPYGSEPNLYLLANVIAREMEGATAIFRSLDRLAAHSTFDHPIDDLHRRVIATNAVPDDVLRSFRASDHVHNLVDEARAIRIEPSDSSTELTRRRLDVCVRWGEEIIGAISVVEGHTPFDDASAAKLEQLVMMATPQLVRDRAARIAAYANRTRPVRAALDVPSRTEELAAYLELDAGAQVRVLCFDAEPADPPGDSERLADLISLCAADEKRAGAAAQIGSRAYLIIPQTDAAGVLEIARRITGDVSHAVQGRLACGVGVPTSLSELATARWTAERALQAARSSETEPVMSAEQLGGQIVLDELRGRFSLAAQAAVPGLADLLTYDRAHGTSYADTLRAYLEALGDAAQAADTLAVHENTVRYRIQKVRQFFDIDLNDRDQRLAMMVALGDDHVPTGME